MTAPVDFTILGRILGSMADAAATDRSLAGHDDQKTWMVACRRVHDLDYAAATVWLAARDREELPGEWRRAVRCAALSLETGPMGRTRNRRRQAFILGQLAGKRAA